MPHLIELIALLTFVGAIGSTLFISLSRAAALDHDPSLDAALSARPRISRDMGCDLPHAPGTSPLLLRLGNIHMK